MVEDQEEYVDFDEVDKDIEKNNGTGKKQGNESLKIGYDFSLILLYFETKFEFFSTWQ